MTADQEYSDEEWVTLQSGYIERLEAILRELTAERDALWLTAQEVPRLQALLAQLTKARDQAEQRVAELERLLRAASEVKVS